MSQFIFVIHLLGNILIMDAKEKKRIYDIEYRKKNQEKILKAKKQYYETNKADILRKQKESKDNDEHRKKHAEYCRQPNQRKKEKLNRHRRIFGKGYLNENKLCISCNKEKNRFLQFTKFNVFPDGRLHICKSCERKHQKEYGCSTRNVMTAIVMRRYTNLTREDIAKYPYLIEANKFLILLKQITK